jgi:hypothetical protein
MPTYFWTIWRSADVQSVYLECPNDTPGPRIDTISDMRWRSTPQRLPKLENNSEIQYVVSRIGSLGKPLGLEAEIAKDDLRGVVARQAGHVSTRVAA